GRKHQWTAQLISARDHLEQQICVTSVIGQVSNFVHAQYGRSGVAAQPPCQLRGAVLGGQVVEHVGGGSEARGVAAQHRLVQQILGDHTFAEAIWADDDDVGGLLKEGKGEQL